MISLILYGRNDSHGYNLHKRAAISLNAMAEVLTDPDDEILFVDYNTPDDLPTFIEAIADTLSAKARAMLRVLRVRPALHARFRDKTHLVALESIARNVALRRANRANRWVLSTNTDMIFVPHTAGASLSDIVRDLPDGFYQLPRMELPESLWEAFDRQDGAGIIARTRALAQRYHLNEIVYGSDQVLYDGPGDFQLCLQTDLRGIDGFHEGMLRGWHVDANLCVRMIALRGEIKSLAGKLYGYHCDHTRQATPSHRHDRVENDSAHFLKISKPSLPEQRDSWGMPEAEIEEVRLGDRHVFERYVSALDAAIPAPQRGEQESRYRLESYDTLEYRRAHVLPFVVDLIAAYPRGARILYAGARADMGADLVTACAALGADLSVLAPSEFGWLDNISATSAPLQSALQRADILIFEFGTVEPGQSASDEQVARLVEIRRAFRDGVEAEQARVAQGCAPRRVLAVNAIHNRFETLVAGSIGFTLTPFSSRVRHGYVLQERSAPNVASFAATGDAASVWRDLQGALQRSRALPLVETQELTRLAKAMAPDRPIPSEALVCAELLIALLRHDHVEIACGVPRDKARKLAERLEVERPGLPVRRALFTRYGPMARATPTKALSRLADASDWEKPSFARFASDHFGGEGAVGFPERNLWTWERAAALDVLAEGGCLTRSSRVLVVSTVADEFAPVLAEYVGGVSVARAPRVGAYFTPATPDDPDPRAFDREMTPAGVEEASFDAVVFLQQTLMLRGPRHVAEALSLAARMVKPGGLITCSVGVSLLGARGVTEFSAGPLIDGAFGLSLRDSRASLEFCGPLEAGLTPSTCDRVIDHARADLRYRRLLARRGGAIGGEGLITFRRLDGPAERAMTRDALIRVIDLSAFSTARRQVRKVIHFGERAAHWLRREIDRRGG